LRPAPFSPSSTSAPLRVAREAPFIGRARERAVLAHALLEAQGGDGSAWLVEGPTGIGKTRLVRWAQERAEKQGFRTLWGSALKEVSSPFFLFEQLFESEPPNPEALPPREGEMGFGSGNPPAGTSSAHGGRESPAQRMTSYLDELERRGPRQALLLVADDLQWADPDSLRTFQFLARNIRGLAVVLLGAVRTDELFATDEEAGEGVRELREAMGQEGTLQPLRLRGFGEEEALELARGLFGHPVLVERSHEVMQDLLRRSGGNPYILKETLGRLAAEGGVTRDGEHVVLGLLPGEARKGPERGPPLPESLQRLVSRRLGGLAPEEREVLRWAAIGGSEFELEPLEGVVPPSADPLSIVLQRLAGPERLLEERGGGRWAFAHPLLWEVCLSELERAERARRARLLAQWWSVHRPDDPQSVARLYHDAMDAENGLPWGRKAIERSVDARAWEQVEGLHTHLQALLEVSGAGTEARVREGLAVASRMLEKGGATREVTKILRSLRELVPVGEQRSELEAYLAVCIAAAIPTEARALLSGLRARDPGGEEEGPGQGTPLLRALRWLAEARLAILEARDAEGVERTSRVLAAGPQLPLWVRVWASYYSGVALAHEGRLQEAQRRLKELEGISGPTGNPYLQAFARSLEMFVTELTGEVAAHRRACEATLALRREAGSSENIAVGLYNLGEGLVGEGDLEGATHALHALQKHAKRFRVERSALYGPLLEGLIALRERRWKDALVSLNRARDAAIRGSDNQLLNPTRLYLAEAFLGSGEIALARGELREVPAAGTELPSYMLPETLLVEGGCAMADGDAPEAKRCFEEAVRFATASGHLLNQGRATSHLALWEKVSGDPKRVETLRAQANVLFDRAGVLPRTWARAWPPPHKLARGPS
jgi:tetratricopeptide (TPR) repeat protein